jgi:DNA-binding response OmpR family regulator
MSDGLAASGAVMFYRNEEKAEVVILCDDLDKENVLHPSNIRQPDMLAINRVIARPKIADETAQINCRTFCNICKLAEREIYLTVNCYIKNRFLFVSGQSKRMSGAAFRMLCAFHQNEGKTLTKEFLLEYVWRDNSKVLNNVNVIVSEIRTILDERELEIITIRGSGYQLINKTKGQ